MKKLLAGLGIAVGVAAVGAAGYGAYKYCEGMDATPDLDDNFDDDTADIDEEVDDAEDIDEEASDVEEVEF